MKNANSLMSLVLLSVMAASCVNLNGHLDVKQAMSAKKKSGFLHLKTTEVQIKPDLYTAELKINSDKNFTLKLEGHDSISLPIKGSKDLNVPSTGKVFISHNDIAQPFDVGGDIVTTVTDSDRIYVSEECSWSVMENHCKKACDVNNSCSITCKNEAVTLHGFRAVTYHYRNTDRDLSINFLKVDKGEVLASFHGTSNTIDRIEDFVGECRTR
jgi:hypothetical protein